MNRGSDEKRAAWAPRRGDRYRAAVVGAGSWGTAFSRLLALRGLDVALLSRRQEQARSIDRTRRNPDYLRNIELPAQIEAAACSEYDFANVDLVVMAVPSKAYGAIAADLAERIARDVRVLSLTKGIDPTTLQRFSEVLGAVWKEQKPRIAILSGPNHAEEVAMDQPTATVITSEDEDYAWSLQHMVSSEVFRAYVNTDVVGVEIAGAVKNVIGLATGLSDGLGYGDNARAALMTRGLAEIARLGETLGAHPLTFAGLAGMGDLVATCTSQHSRNRLAGELIARGHSPAQVEIEMGMVAEGLTAAPAILRLAERGSIELPITKNVVAVCREGMDIRDAVRDLMVREPRDEVKDSRRPHGPSRSA